MSEASRQASEPYQFGDTALAAQRLRLLADVFAPSSREFLELLAASHPREILDLGCGPGCTTRLLAELFPAANVRGADSSEHFIDLARQTPHNRVLYVLADATRHLPGGPYDLIYCRYLLTHVCEPEAALATWADSLRPQGRIAIEENEWIHTTQAAFARYLGIAGAMLRDAGQELYIGPALDRASRPSLVKELSEVVPIAAGDRDSARMFCMNLETWRTRPFIRQNYSDWEIDALYRELAAVAHDDLPTSSITFARRRLVLRRADA
jgi:SAM-dependent methyltransferase